MKSHHTHRYGYHRDNYRDYHREHSYPLPLLAGDTLAFHAVAADLQILPLDAGEPRLEVVTHPAHQPGVQIDRQVLKDGVATVSIDVAIRDQVELRLIVPAACHARIHSDFGRVRLERLTDCSVEVFSNAGLIQAQEITGALRLRSSAGTIVGRGLSGRVHAETNAGSIKLWIDSLDEGTHVVRTNMGAVKLMLKAGLDVRIEAEAHMGSVRTRYPSNPNAQTVLSLHTDLGSVKVLSESDDKRPDDWLDIDTWTDWVSKLWQKSAHAQTTRGAVSVAKDEAKDAPTRASKSHTPPLDEEALSRLREGDDSLSVVLTLVKNGKLSPTEAEKILSALEI